MANPLAWLPFHGDKRSRRAALLGGALVLSLGMHVAMPFVRWQSIEAVSESPVQVTLMPPPPMPLPEDDKLKVAPDPVDSPAPRTDDAPAPAPKEPQQAKPAVEPVDDPEPAEPPKMPAVEVPDAAARLAAYDKRRADRIAERERRRADREARLAAARASGGTKGGAPDSGTWKIGTPAAAYLCNAEDRGTELHVTKERPLSEWIAIVPTVLAGFDTRPGLGGYLERTQQVVTRDRTQRPSHIGFVEMALPDEVIQLPLDEPRGVRVAIGRLDGHCLVGFKYSARLFPFSILRAPARIVDGMNNSVSALIDITLFKDASIEITASERGVDLPFAKGRLKNGAGIQKNIEDHYEAAKLAKAIADLFGITFAPHTSTVTTTKPPPQQKRATVAETKAKHPQE